MNIKLVFFDPDDRDETGNCNIITCPKCGFQYVDRHEENEEGLSIGCCRICKNFFSKKNPNIPIEKVRELFPDDERLDEF